MKNTLVGIAFLSSALLSLSGLSASAATGTDEDLFGTSAYFTPGNASPRAVKIEADVGTEFGGVDYLAPTGGTIDNFNALSTDTFYPAGSDCGGGSPRFAIQLTGVSGTIFVYMEPQPVNTGCPSGVWANTSNLLTPTSLVDTSQLPGGTFYDTWGAAQVRYTGKIVEDVFVVTDTFAGPRTVVLDNTNVNGTLYQYEDVSFYVDHYACYDAQPLTRFQQRSVTLRDEFGPPAAQNPNTMKVRTPSSFCTPVDKNGEGINFKDFQLVCYDVDEQNTVRTVITVDNQFGDDQKLLVTNRRQLCVPSTDEIIVKLPGHHHNDDYHHRHGHHGRW